MTNEDRKRLLRYRTRFKRRGANASRADRPNPAPRLNRGDQRGSLTVTAANYLNITMCLARCICGSERAYRVQDLLDGKRTHCGCRRGAALGEGRAAPEQTQG